MIQNVHFKVLLCLVLCSTFTLQSLFAKKTHSNRKKAKTPQEELAGFSVPEGFVVELVASEKDGVVNPIDLTFDDAGRLWTQTGKMYPLDPKDVPWGQLLKLMDHPNSLEIPEFKRVHDFYQGRKKGDDKILIIKNPDQPGKSKVHVWYEGLAQPTSILPYKNGAYVTHHSDLIFLNDQDGDGKAETWKQILTGFGFVDTHTTTHLLIRAPGGWVNFSQGALNKGEVTAVESGVKVRFDYCKNGRFSLDHQKLELVNAGLNNIWGYTLRHNGQWYGSEANDHGFSVAPMEAGTAYSGIGQKKLRPYQPFMPNLHRFRVGGTGLSGLAFSDDREGGFPKEWRDVAFLANPITNRINVVRIKRLANGQVEAKHLPDFLTSKDDWFRPVNMAFGPDGCLYIADWYNKIISHNEVPRSHPDRDKSHGRIWRIRHVSQKARTIPNLYKVKSDQLITHIQAPLLWEKRAAWHQIVDRQSKELVPDLIKLLNNEKQDVITRIIALWSLEGLKHYDKTLMQKLLQSKDDDLRRESVRALASFSISADELAERLAGFENDTNAMVRSQAIRTYADAKQANLQTIDALIQFCRPALKGNTLGGSYERAFERYLARKTLEQYPQVLTEYLSSPLSNKAPASNIMWAVQVLPKDKKTSQFLALWNKLDHSQLPDEQTLIEMAKMASEPKVKHLIAGLFKDPKTMMPLLHFSRKHQSQVQNHHYSAMLTPAIKHLLKNQNAGQVDFALDTAARLKVPGVGDDVRNILSSSTAKQKTKALALNVLASHPHMYKDSFKTILQDKKLNYALRLSALNAFVTANLGEAQAFSAQWIPQLKEDQKKKLIDTLSKNRNGARSLLNLKDQKVLGQELFSVAIAERIQSLLRRDRRAKAFYAQLKDVEKQKKTQHLNEKMKKWLAIAEKNPGNPKAGQITFQGMCLSCHSVSGKGAGFAPPLDGSGHRSNEGLLTALLEPDLAFEGNYGLYRVTKKDGGLVEGYLEKKEKNGRTLRFMGGGKVFIPHNDIKNENYVVGRSMMPSGLLSGLSDEQGADLIAYIKTLKTDDAVSIFDGKTLKGWNVPKQHEKLWWVQDGVITGGSLKHKVRGNTFLATDKSYQNFDLRFSIKITHGSGFVNSGIQIRSIRKGLSMSGYQVDAGDGWWGKMYDEHRRNKVIASSKQLKAVQQSIVHQGWNDYRILCEGKRIRTWINGVPAIDYTEKDSKIAQDGHIGLQVHGGGKLLVQVKDISIIELAKTKGLMTWGNLSKK